MEKMDSSNDTFKSADFDPTDHQQGKQTGESVDIFESIKDDEYDDEDYRKKTRRRLIIIAVSAVILVLLILGAIIGILVPLNTKSNSTNNKDLIKFICNSTLYPDYCYSSIHSLKLSTTENPGPEPDGPKEIFMLSLQVALRELVRVKSFLLKDQKHDSFTQNALDACEKLFQDAIDDVGMSLSCLQQDKIDDGFTADDIRTWLSAAITDQETCLNGLTEFVNISDSIKEEMNLLTRNATISTSNSLAIISKMPTIVQPGPGTVRREVLQLSPEKGFRPNLTVAKDGSGHYQTIREAVSAMPRRSKDRFFVYVKEGEYEENVVVDSDSWNLVIYGDGMNKSVVSGSLNYADGVATYNSGTFIAEGRGFIAKDMGFKNTAGPNKLQAVALRSSSDQSMFIRCSFDAYQDTLYIHSNRQFYSQCLITGTIDFIFGNAAAVFQNCSIRPRQPGPGQYNTVTAQSKSDPNQNTGISIMQSRISPLGNLTAQSFLGRPWNVYSTTVVMETEIQRVIDPAGWVPWEPSGEVPDTIFYAEYKNTGPGSVLDGRVTWPGYKPGITEEDAENFSIEKFIQGNKWLSKGDAEHE